MPLVKARPLSIYTVPDFWWCIKANGLFTLVLYQWDVFGVAMNIPKWKFFERGCSICWTELSPWFQKCVFPNASCPLPCLEGRNDALRERELEGKPALQLKCWMVAWLLCVGKWSLATSVVFNQVQVWPSCWCLVFGIGRWKRLDSPLMHRLYWRLSAQRWN